MSRQYEAVLFDLLSALLDSWSLWDELAGKPELGRLWRMRFLEAAASTERYIPYLSLVADAARDVGVEPSQANMLANRWSDLAPWPEALDMVAELATRVRVGVVSNCSEELGVCAASKVSRDFAVVVTAERAGYYKPDKRVYETAIKEIDATPERILFVAGSPYDVAGAADVGMPVYWHNRLGMNDPEIESKTIQSSETLTDLRNLVV